MSAHPDFPPITVRAVARIARMPDVRRARALQRLVRQRLQAALERYVAEDLETQTRRIIYGDAALDEPRGILTARAGEAAP